MRKFILMILLVCAGMVQAGEYAYLSTSRTTPQLCPSPT